MLKKENTYRYYPLRKTILVNEQVINRIIISSHYEEKHSKCMSDEIILGIVVQLDGRNFPVIDRKTNPKRDFFMLDNIFYQGRQYRLV